MTTEAKREYGIHKDLDMPYDKAVERVKEALKDEGFGVLWEIDVPATLKKKLDIDFGKQYVILGSCNPKLAHQALEAETELGLLLPCNVIVYETDDGTAVSAMDPILMMGIVDNPAVKSVANAAADKLNRVIQNV